jgi:transcriptional regulator with XRE-family HTH domain
MKNTKKTGKRGGSSIKKQVGQRFKEFREAIGKTQHQLADEFGVYQSTITNIEVGKTFPGIKYLFQLGENYGLNADWVVNNRGEMFIDPSFVSPSLFKKYKNLIFLMQVPVVEQLILARLEEIKVLAREDITNFQALQNDIDAGTKA